MKQVIIGIDVASDTFEAAFTSESDGALLRQESYRNTRAGHRRFVKAAQDGGPGAHVVMEATGGYHLRLSKALLKAEELTQSVVNPLQVKRFSQMKLRRVKTDRSDAALIARYGREQKPGETAPDGPSRAKLKQISTLIDQLTKQRTALKNQRHATEQLPDSAEVCEEVIDQQLEALDEQIEKLKEEQERLAEEQFTATKELIESVKGVGSRTTCALKEDLSTAYAGDLSTFDSHKQLSAFMGLNPVVSQSGQSKNEAHISKQGHAKLRSLFYMGAQTARKYNSTCRALYDRLRERGKARKVALIAVANKLVKQVFAVVKSQTLFDNDYHKKSLAT